MTQDDLAAAAEVSTDLIRQGRFLDAQRVALAARDGRAGAATELLTEATAVAGRTGVDRAFPTRAR